MDWLDLIAILRCALEQGAIGGLIRRYAPGLSIDRPPAGRFECED